MADADEVLVQLLDQLQKFDQESREALTLLNETNQPPLIRELLVRRVRGTLDCYRDLATELRSQVTAKD